MRIKPHIVNTILLTLAISLWVIMLIFHVWQHTIAQLYDGPFAIDNPLYKVAFVGFLAANALYFMRIYSKIEKLNVITLLWRLFIIGMGGITFILILIITYFLSRQLTLNAYLPPILYTFSLYGFLIFFLAATFIFRRFVLYQRNKRRLITWHVFVGGLGVSLLFALLPSSGITQVAYPVFLLLFVLLCLFLSGNVRWIAYLNFNQKLKALGLFALILVVSATYIIIAQRFPDILNFQLQLPSYLFLYCILIFTIIYSLVSILVLFFNLPTSSIFELKSLEIASFNKINQAIQSNLDYSAIINSLLDASMMAANSKSGWIEMISPETGLPEISLYKRITPRDIQALKQGNELTEKVIRDQRHFQIKNLRKHRAYKNHNTRYRTLLCVPITSSSQTYGVVYIANEVVNSFEDVTIQSIITFAEQAGMALENAHLIKNSIELERYQEQLKIAKEVQTQLLPQQLPYSPELEFAAESENAQEVGGDYFDVVQVNEHLFKLAIGDVSGKGTTAAFYMAEIKGIFHALSQLDLDVRTFVCCANKALAKCIQKGFFVTLTYLHINTQTKQIDMLRAGHCPAFFYRKASDEIQMLRDGTLGLGIVRNDSFGNFLGQGETLHYQPGDFLVLYTDGIVEARDEHGEEFGYERFEQIIARHKAAAASTLASEIVQAAKEFTHSELQDDYTVLVIRFR